MNFIWKKTYETGIQEIDIQHKKFFSLINELYEAVVIDENEIAVERIITDLKDYSKYHFTSEEEFMNKINYPEKESQVHCKCHQAFIKKFKEIESDITVSLNIKAYQLADFLKKWLSEHILKSDMEYLEFYKNNNL